MNFYRNEYVEKEDKIFFALRLRGVGSFNCHPSSGVMLSGAKAPKSLLLEPPLVSGK